MLVDKVSGDLVICTWVSNVNRGSKVFAHLLEKVKVHDLKDK